MKRMLLTSKVWAVAVFAVLAIACRRDIEEKPWKTRDVWYSESDVAQLSRTGRAQLVEFFHPD